MLTAPARYEFDTASRCARRAGFRNISWIPGSRLYLRTPPILNRPQAERGEVWSGDLNGAPDLHDARVVDVMIFREEHPA